MRWNLVSIVKISRSRSDVMHSGAVHDLSHLPRVSLKDLDVLFILGQLSALQIHCTMCVYLADISQIYDLSLSLCHIDLSSLNLVDIAFASKTPECLTRLREAFTN